MLTLAEGILSVSNFELEGGYLEFAAVIEKFCREGLISPIKSSGIYPRTPPLALRYRINKGTINNYLSVSEEEKLIQELISLHPKIKKDYYLKNISHYLSDRKNILRLNSFFSDNDKNASLKHRYTLNERSFEIFNDEKYLSQHGEAFLKRIGLDTESLNCYKTYEAFFYVLFEREYIVPDKDRYNEKERNKTMNTMDYTLNTTDTTYTSNVLNVLIVENKDTFMSIMKLLNTKKGYLVGGKIIDLLIYGEGKKIISSFKFMEELAKGHIIGNVYYYGDIDYEGIAIYLILKNSFSQYNIIPHVKLYNQLVDSTEFPPELRSKQNEISVEEFLDFFEEKYRTKISRILKEKKYIPQEALSFGRIN